jgi:hypothetical protein
MAKITIEHNWAGFFSRVLEKLDVNPPYEFDDVDQEPEDYEPTIGNVYVEDDSMI